MTKAIDIIHAIETITNGLKVTTSDGTYRVVGVSCADRMILVENATGSIFKIYPMEVKTIEQTGTVTIEREIKP